MFECMAHQRSSLEKGSQSYQIEVHYSNIKGFWLKGIRALTFIVYKLQASHKFEIYATQQKRNWETDEYTHSTRPTTPRDWDISTGFRPVISSRRTTPNEYTSDFSVNFPLIAYSGAIYLKFEKDKIDAYPVEAQLGTDLISREKRAWECTQMFP